MSKNTFKRYVDLILIQEEVLCDHQRFCNTFIDDHTLHRGRKHFCHYCLQTFSTKEILKYHVEDCFKINGKQSIKVPKKDEYVKFKNYERQIKSPFMIYAGSAWELDFKDIKSPVKVSVVHKIKKKNSITISVLVMKTKKNIQSMCQKILSKDCWFIIDWRRGTMFLSKILILLFMIIHYIVEENIFCCYCLQAKMPC